MNSTTRFKVNAPDVIHETIDGETVIINLDSGNYYSLNQSGADIWDCVADGTTVDETVAAVARKYNGSRAAIEHAVNNLIAELQREKLIVPNGEGETRRGAGLGVPEGEKLDFAAPALQAYTDMQDLLLLDPIHEVDETGWPNANLNSAN